MYILEKSCLLRGWKNLPWAVECEMSPDAPVRITEALARKLSAPFEYSGGDSILDGLIRRGCLEECDPDAKLPNRQQYRQYGCLHFDQVIFSITGRCNYHCMHCSVNAPNNPMTEIPFDRVCSLLDEIKECGLKNIVLIGGEPLIRQDFLRIVDEVVRRGLFVSEIFTNGSLVTESLLEMLERRHVRPLFMLSFDGTGYHDRMRGVPGAEKDFERCVKLLTENGWPVSANMCVTRESLPSLWPTIRKLSALGVGSLTVYPPAACGLWEAREKELGVTMAELTEEYTKVIEEYTAAGWPMDLNLYGLAYFSGDYRKYALTPKWRVWGDDPAASPACRTFLSELNISPEGLLSPCYALMSDKFVRNSMPDLHRMSLKQALTDSAFTRIMEMTAAGILEHNPKCRACEFFPRCGGGCRLSAYKNTGDFASYDPQMCFFFEHRTEQKFRDAVIRGRLRYRASAED